MNMLSQPHVLAVPGVPWAAKRRANELVRNAIRNGRLKRQPCIKCGAAPGHAHHEDYAKPLNVTWLCPKHHHGRHTELRLLARAESEAA